MTSRSGSRVARIISRIARCSCSARALSPRRIYKRRMGFSPDELVGCGRGETRMARGRSSSAGVINLVRCSSRACTRSSSAPRELLEIAARTRVGPCRHGPSRHSYSECTRCTHVRLLSTFPQFFIALVVLSQSLRNIFTIPTHGCILLTGLKSMLMSQDAMLALDNAFVCVIAACVTPEKNDSALVYQTRGRILLRGTASRVLHDCY